MLSANSISFSMNKEKKQSDTKTNSETEKTKITETINSLTSLSDHKITMIQNNNRKIDALTNEINIDMINDKLSTMTHDFMVSCVDDKFIFYESINKTLYGSFSIDQLIKYIGSQQLKEFNDATTDIGFSESIIKKFIGDVSVDPDTDKIIINLKSPLESPLMGNINILININNKIFFYENNKLDNDLGKINDPTDRKKIKRIIKQFIYALLTHTLKVISTISNEIKDKNKPELKNNLLKYSVGITYRLSAFVKDHIDSQMMTVDKLNNNLEKLIKIRQSIDDKLKKYNTSSTSSTSSVSSEEKKFKNNKVNISSINISEFFKQKSSEKNNSFDESENESNVESISSNSDSDNEKDTKQSVTNDVSEILDIKNI